MMIRKATKYLGKILELSNKYSLARKVYNTINLVDSICRLYEIELKAFRSIE